MTRIPTWQVRLYGNPWGVRPWLCGVESSPTKMSCVYACVKNIRKVSRNVWMHFEGGMVSVYIRQKFTLHSWKKNDLNSRSLTFTIPPSRGILVEYEEGSFFFVVSKTQSYALDEFSEENVLFSAPLISINVWGRSEYLTDQRAEMSVHGVYLCDWLAKCLFLNQINLFHHSLPCQME